MLDTMDAQNIRLTNFVYQGGDDCIAIKPRSYNVFVQNATCHGGNGMAIGSLGQYLEDSSVENVIMNDVNVSFPLHKLFPTHLRKNMKGTYNLDNNRS